MRGGNKNTIAGYESGPAGREIADDRGIFHNLKVKVGGNPFEAHSNLVMDPNVLKQVEPLLKK